MMEFESVCLRRFDYSSGDLNSLKGMHFCFYEQSAVLLMSDETDNQQGKVKCSVEDSDCVTEAGSLLSPTTDSLRSWGWEEVEMKDGKFRKLKQKN
jgi:hypothetical protein